MKSALVLVALAALYLPSIDAIAKLLSDAVPAGQVAWIRFLVQFCLLLPFSLYAWRRFRVRSPLIHILRGVLLSTTTVLIFAAVKWMPIADTIAIFFLEPLFVTLLSAAVLGERIGWRRPLAAIAGFAGALLVIRPSFGLFGSVALLPLCAAFSFACYIVLTRYQARRGESPVTMQLVAGLSGLACMSAAIVAGLVIDIPVFALVRPTAEEWGLLILSGIIATAGHLMITMACRHLEAATVAPIQYLEIVGATAFGYWLFADFPDAVTWVGILIIVGAGLYTFHRERLRSEPG